MKKFDSINIGETAKISHKITNEDIRRFIELTGDDNKLHIDEKFAKKTSFKKPVAHGFLGASFISTIIGTQLPGDGALWFEQTLQFLLPVRIGDTITIKAEVIKKHSRMQVIELSTDIFNQNRQKVTSGIAKVKIVEQQTVISNENCKKENVALVIGGTGGIGEATCLKLADEGFDIAIHYYKNENSARDIMEKILAKGRRAYIVKADITQADQVEMAVNSTIRKLNNITALVNCAVSDIPFIKFPDLVWNDIQNSIDINLKGVFNLCKFVVPIMKENKYGKIVNISTMVTDKPSTEWLHYVVAKSSLNGFTKALAVELGPMGVRVNLVSPGMTDTSLIANIPEKAKLLYEAQTPLRSIANPNDIASAICYLASKRSDYITGETIRVNGGQVML